MKFLAPAFYGIFSSILIFVSSNVLAELLPLASIKNMSQEFDPQLMAWRRDFHQHPDLSNCELRTAEIIAEYLQSR